MNKNVKKWRQDLVFWALAQLGTRSSISQKTGISEDRLQKWVYEGAINKRRLPDLIPLQRQKKIKLPWLLLVMDPCDEGVTWPASRKQLQRVLLMLGGPKRIAKDLNTSITTVKHWGARTVREPHLWKFLELCRVRFYDYGGGILKTSTCIRSNKYGICLDIYPLYRQFTKVHLISKRRSENWDINAS